MTITAERTPPATTGSQDFAAARRAMIDSQLRVSGVNEDWVLTAMGEIPREDYVPAAARSHAYIDRAIALGDGHALPAPLVHGRMLAEAAPQADDKVLLVSCGSNYLAALVNAITGSVTVVPAAEATSGEKSAGKDKGSYSLLLIDGAIEQLPDSLAAQLAEGGRVVTGLVDRGVTRLAAGRKIGGAISLLPLTDIGIPVLGEFAAKRGWSF